MAVKTCLSSTFVFLAIILLGRAVVIDGAVCREDLDTGLCIYGPPNEECIRYCKEHFDGFNAFCQLIDSKTVPEVRTCICEFNC
ncbi:OLC1v1038170C1 [Oldenlandia corymbosa var. corymbosa]|uniref:OLC1v1038170C1 n=1 Tax=Oldenlandia corymbosa var. corymbosa TaxID=529605 RepID=A0AAV1CZU8_OLDCO|nr:OLC1v1038170C1 [Oldenlandia corymbosa var. corymbosa]